MIILSEEKKEDLLKAWIKVPHVNDSCIGCGACVAISPEVFDLDEEGKSIVIDADFYDNSSVNDSISACPVDAIHWD